MNLGKRRLDFVVLGAKEESMTCKEDIQLEGYGERDLPCQLHPALKVLISLLSITIDWQHAETQESIGF